MWCGPAKLAYSYYTVNFTIVPIENAQAVTTFNFPQTYCLVGGSRKQHFLIGAPSYALDGARVTFKNKHAATCINIPQSRGCIGTAGNDKTLVWAQCHTPNRLSMPLKCLRTLFRP
jgi:hypothetical protein